MPARTTAGFIELMLLFPTDRLPDDSARWSYRLVARRLVAALVAAAAVLTIGAGRVRAQVTPAGGFPPPDDTPSVRVGGTLFVDYTRTLNPEISDVDGNLVNPSAVNVGRAYLNVTGQINHLVAFRITPDVSRETGTGSSLAGSLTFRLKCGYAELNLDDWMWRGSHVRLGMIQTPYVEFEENIYRYRFQGTVFVDREAFMSSADLGVSFRTQFPGGYGEVIGGLYNGEGYTQADPNDQKALQVRATLRPFPAPGPIHGLRLTAFYDADHYVKDGERRRAVTLVSYEYRYLNAGWVFLDATDQPRVSVAEVDARGHSIWVTPRWFVGQVIPAAPAGQVRPTIEGLFRYDRLEPDLTDESVKQRWIAGVAYWPRVNTSSVTSAVLLDYEQVSYRDFVAERPTEKRLAVHVLLGF